MCLLRYQSSALALALSRWPACALLRTLSPARPWRCCYVHLYVSVRPNQFLSRYVLVILYSPVSVSLCLCVFVSLCLCVCVSLYLCVDLSMCLCASVSMFWECVYVSVCLCVRVSLFLCLSLCIHVLGCLFAYVSTCCERCMSTCWECCMSVCQYRLPSKIRVTRINVSMRVAVAMSTSHLTPHTPHLTSHTSHRSHRNGRKDKV